MKKLLTLLSAITLLCTVHGTIQAGKQETSASIGKEIADFSLQDFRGKRHALADYQDAKAIVVVFLGTECPLCKLYGPRLAKLAAEFDAKGVVFLGVDANRQDSVTELAAFARLHGISFPLLKDTGNSLADQFGARRTPEVFLLDSERVIRYQGRIDDQYGFQTGSGYQRARIKRRDLAEAITEVLANQTVSQPYRETVGCIIGRIREPNEQSEVTYSNQIARLFQGRCVECHRPGQIGPFSLTSYDEAVGWAEMIEEVVREQRMPPWHADPRHGKFLNDSGLTKKEKELIYDWVANGAPEGDPAELPEPVEFSGEWMMPGEPDLVVYMQDEPYDVPAEGVVEYQYFRVNPGFKEDKWVRIAECMPGNRSVVHHIIVFLRLPNGSFFDIAEFGQLTGFAPGTRPFVLPDGMAKLVPAGAELIFQLHYTPNGTPQKDRSAVGIQFVKDPATITHRVVTLNAINTSFVIPPHAEAHPVESSRKFERDVLLLSLFPHMHLRGKDFLYELHYPAEQKETLLVVPQYDFNWQNSFILAEPKKLPAGTTLHCTAHFDNSENNLANPDPSEQVRWGDQTWEEMMIGWFDIALPVDVSLADAVPSVARDRRNRRERRGRGDGEEVGD